MIRFLKLTGLLLASAAMIYAASTDVVSITEPRPINGDDALQLLRKTATSLDTAAAALGN